MNNWYNFVAFGFCLGMAISSFIHRNWGIGAIQATMACINLPFILVK